MAEKKENPGKPKIEIQTRKPEKRGIFANLGNDRSTDPHPLRDILNFSSDNLDTQNADSGHPNNPELGTQTTPFPDTQKL